MFPMGGISSISLPVPETIRLDKDASTNIKYFKNQWTRYCLATSMDKVSEEVKLNIMRTMMGKEAVNFIDVMDITNHNHTCDQLLQALENYFIPRNKNVVFERFCFNSIEQYEKESITDYLSRITKQAMKCEFTENITEIVRDKFVAGLHDDFLRNSLVTSALIHLDFPEIVAFCKEKENNPSPIPVTVERVNNFDLKPTIPSLERVFTPPCETTTVDPFIMMNVSSNDRSNVSSPSLSQSTVIPGSYRSNVSSPSLSQSTVIPGSYSLIPTTSRDQTMPDSQSSSLMTRIKEERIDIHETSDRMPPIPRVVSNISLPLPKLIKLEKEES